MIEKKFLKIYRLIAFRLKAPSVCPSNPEALRFGQVAQKLQRSRCLDRKDVSCGLAEQIKGS